MPALGLSLLLVAAGLVLALAVGTTAGGVSLVAVGLILAGVGAFGVLLSLVFMSGLFATRADDTGDHADHTEHAHH